MIFKRAGWSSSFVDFMNLLEKKALYKNERKMENLKLKYIEFLFTFNDSIAKNSYLKFKRRPEG